MELSFADYYDYLAEHINKNHFQHKSILLHRPQQAAHVKLLPVGGKTSRSASSLQTVMTPLQSGAKNWAHAWKEEPPHIP